MKYSRILLCLLVGVVIHSGLVAQTKTEVVHLKDGTVLKGIIVSDDDYKIQLVISTGDTLDIGYKLIDHFGDEPRAQRSSIPLEVPSSGYTFDLGVMTYLSHSREASLEFQAGRILSKDHHLGIMARYRLEEYNIQVWSSMQNYMDLGVFYRYFIGKSSKVRPFAELSGGVSMLVSESSSLPAVTSTNPHATLSFGARFKVKKRFGLFLKAGVSHNRTSVVSSEQGLGRGFEITFDFEKSYLTPHFSAGISF